MWKRLFSTVANTTSRLIKNAELISSKKVLSVTWSDGVQTNFPFIWLRDMAPAPHTFVLTDVTKVRTLRLLELDLNVQPESFSFDQSKVDILWPNQKPVTYTADWLNLRNLDDKNVRQRRKEVRMPEKKLWDSATFKSSHLRWWDFEQLMIDDICLHDALSHLVAVGVILIDKIPQKQGALRTFTDRVGFHQTCHYGEFFQVLTRSNPNNLAYTSHTIGYHTDLAYCETPPEVQLLHVIKQFEGQGGENQLVDGFYVAKVLKEKHPEVYKILTTVQFEYIDEGKDFMEYDMIGSWPVFTLDASGEVKSMNHHQQSRTWFVDLPFEEIPKIYEALKTLEDYLYHPDHHIDIKLNSGQLVVFDNLRIPHARKGFVMDADTERHLEGTYFSWDTVKSRIRVIRDKHDLQPTQISF